MKQSEQVGAVSVLLSASFVCMSFSHELPSIKLKSMQSEMMTHIFTAVKGLCALPWVLKTLDVIAVSLSQSFCKLSAGCSVFFFFHFTGLKKFTVVSKNKTKKKPPGSSLPDSMTCQSLEEKLPRDLGSHQQLGSLYSHSACSMCFYGFVTFLQGLQQNKQINPAHLFNL